MLKKIAKSSLIVIFRFIYFLPVLMIVIFITLLFGNKILGPGLTGSDNANFITLADWLSKWFPRIPFWFPQEGGGMSFTISYPILNHLIVVVLEKISKLPIVIVFRIYSLVTVVFTSLGLYLVTFKLTKNQTVAAISAIFYPLMPVTWVFLLMWGFSAEQLSLIFVPSVLILAPLFLDEFYLNGLTKKAKLYFFLFIICFAILPLAHPLVFIGVLFFVSILFIVYPLLTVGAGKVKLRKVILVDLIAMTVIIFTTFYWSIPFLKYQSKSAMGAPVEAEIYNKNAFLQNSIYAVSVFNISDKSVVYSDYTVAAKNISEWAWRNVSFPFIISLLALAGLIGSFFLNRKVFAFGIANLVPLAVAVFPNLDYLLMRFPLSDYFLNWRASITASRFIIPLLAGFGCYAIAYLFTFPVHLLSKKIKTTFLKFSVNGLFVFLSAILTLAVAGVLLWNFKSWPFTNPDFLLSVGNEVNVPSEKIDLRNIWKVGPRDLCYGGGNLTDIGDNNKKLCANKELQDYFLSAILDAQCTQLKAGSTALPRDILALCDGSASKETILGVYQKCNNLTKEPYYSDICQAKVTSIWDQISLPNWEKMLAGKNLFTDGKAVFGGDADIFKLLPDNPDTRVDIGTSIGAFMMIEPFYSNVPELPVYYNQATLIKTLWNYEIGIFNQKKTVWPEDSIMSELSKYFGLGYMIMSENLVPVGKYMRTGWERVYKVTDNAFEGLALWKFDNSVGLLNVSTKPTVLVIGQDKVDGYFRVFHLANLGTIPFDNAILVKGGSYVDNYTPDQLKQFDAVILEGYAYKNQANGWKILDSYVKGGGSLLINNGWQFSSADWNVTSTPAFFPVSKLGWIDPGNGSYSSPDSSLTTGIDISKFSPLVYSGTDWNVSSGNASDLRNWAKVFLSVNNHPLIAGGQYGKGRIIWMGLDLPGHIGAYTDNVDEVNLYGNLVSYLLNGKTGQMLTANLSSTYPDKIEIDIASSSNQKVAVYLSEAYYPDFKAKLISGSESENIKSYIAGPGMTLFILPNIKSGSKIIYEYKTPFEIILAKGISLFTLLGIIIIIIRPQYLGIATRKITELIKKGKFEKRILGSNEDSNY